MYTELNKEYIFEDDRPFNSCHASTLVVLSNGDILSAWFGGTEEGAKDVAIWYARRSNGKWSPPTKIADQDGIPHWNPVLFQNEEGTVFLVYKVGHTIPGWYSMVIKSTDQGQTWSSPVPLVEGDIGGRGPVRCKPITLQDGTMLAPASIESDIWDAFVDISTDQGNSWEASEMVPLDHQNFEGKGVIQPTLWESEPGVVHMLLRSTAGRVYRSNSTDGGKSWTPVHPIALPNNNSGIDVVQYAQGRLALIYNPVGKDWGARTPLVLRLSTDNGETWDHELVLEDEPGEYSYPAIVAKNNYLYITYTWKRERIVFWKVGIDHDRE